MNILKVKWLNVTTLLILLKDSTIVTFPSDALLKVYKSFIWSHLDYGNMIYDKPNKERRLKTKLKIILIRKYFFVQLILLKLPSVSKDHWFTTDSWPLELYFKSWKFPSLKLISVALHFCVYVLGRVKSFISVSCYSTCWVLSNPRKWW